ncbi:hypothetical protein GCM10027059_38790 [Myceligenerans halotolerans]
MILLDTNILIDYDDYEFDTDEQQAASILSRAELEFGIRSASSPHLAALRTRRLNEFDTAYDWVPFDLDCTRSYGMIAAQATTRGAKLRGKDSLIAAQALRHGATLMTANRADFRPFEHLIEVIDPVRREN